MEKVKRYFEKIGFSGDSLALIQDAFTCKTYKKNDLVVEEGKTSKHIGFVESGMFQYFVFKNGEERTTYISIENTFMASLLSFVREIPAMESVRALTDGSISLISRQNLKKLVCEVPGFKDFYIGLLEGAICGIDATGMI